MTDIKTFFKDKFNTCFFISALLVFTYLTYRAINSSLVCDELTTFFHYIQPKSFFFVGNGGDANNHLLNTFFSYLSYYTLGFSSLSIRFFSLLSFIVYVLYVYRFSKIIQHKIQRYAFAFIMLYTLNFLVFFGLSRGYSYSFAFLLGAIYHFYIFAKNTIELKYKQFVYYTILISLALFANIALLLPTLIISFLLLVLLLQNINNFKRLNNKQKLIIATFVLFYIAVIITIISFSFILKSNDALYYGSSSNFWYSVVITQIYLLVESKSLITQVISILLFVLFFIVSIFSYKQMQLKKIHKTNLFFFILVLNILGIEFLTLFLGVNYPSDRIAIYLYIIFILSLFFINTNNNKILNVFKNIQIIIICLIPIHNIATIDYRKNIIWPLDYFPKSYYNKIVENKTEDYYPTVAGNKFRGLNYIKYVYENNGKGNLNVNWEVEDTTLLSKNNHPGKYADYIISKKEDIITIEHLYKKVDSNNVNKICLWERIQTPKSTVINNKTFETTNNYSKEFFDCHSFSIDSLGNNYMLVTIDFDLYDDNLPFNGFLVFNVHDETTNKRLNYQSFDIRFIKDFKSNKTFKQKLYINKLHPTNRIKISSYIWNINKENISIKNGKITFRKFEDV